MSRKYCQKIDNITWGLVIGVRTDLTGVVVHLDQAGINSSEKTEKKEDKTVIETIAARRHIEKELRDSQMDRHKDFVAVGDKELDSDWRENSNTGAPYVDHFQKHLETLTEFQQIWNSQLGQLNKYGQTGRGTNLTGHKPHQLCFVLHGPSACEFEQTEIKKAWHELFRAFSVGVCIVNRIDPEEGRITTVLYQLQKPERRDFQKRVRNPMNAGASGPVWRNGYSRR